MTFPLEDTIIKRTQDQLEIWRQSGLDDREMMTFNAELANYAYTELENIYNLMFGTSSADHIDVIDGSAKISVYPNPSNEITGIGLEIDNAIEADMEIFNSSGQLVKALFQKRYLSAGSYTFEWDGTSEQLNPVPQGIYFVVLTARGERISKACMRL